jgi:hypothetical protein
MLWVRISDNFDVDWFLDGRRKKPTKEQTTAGMRKTSTSMAEDEEAQEGFE